MSMRVCIPTAGTGSRLGSLTKYINKSLVSVGNRPILSHLIEQFPADAEFVIALGHKGHLVREFLELAYPDRKFFFANVSPFEGPGSGLGFSLLQCRAHLKQPFVFISCDTLVREPIPVPTENWMGFAETGDLSPYRTVAVENGTVTDISDKGFGHAPLHKAYIGLAGIADHEQFWQKMETGGAKAIELGESYGLQALLDKKIAALPFTWFDTGNPATLETTRAAFRQKNAPNILEKENEAIWFVGDQVIKFSDDESFIARRVERAAEIKGFVPDITGAQPHMYRYRKANGDILSEAVTLPLFENLLDHAKAFWNSGHNKDGSDPQFKARCLKFYKDKTFERVALFFRNSQKVDGSEPINGMAMPKLENLLKNLNWDWLASGLPGRFHGDFHFENILWSDQTRSFTFLDWRQDFGGSLTIGDIYYDLAKLLHGLIICHELIAKDQYSVVWGKDSTQFDFHRKQILVECENFFENWLVQNSYDAAKVRTLTALIYLNIAPLHHHPYNLLLFALGKSMLFEQTRAI